jgi:hypothetical protein
LPDRFKRSCLSLYLIIKSIDFKDSEFDSKFTFIELFC